MPIPSQRCLRCKAFPWTSNGQLLTLIALRAFPSTTSDSPHEYLQHYDPFQVQSDIVFAQAAKALCNDIRIGSAKASLVPPRANNAVPLKNAESHACTISLECVHPIFICVFDVLNAFLLSKDPWLPSVRDQPIILSLSENIERTGHLRMLLHHVNFGATAQNLECQAHTCIP